MDLKVLRWVLTESQTTGPARQLLTVLAYHLHHETRQCNPSLELLEKEMGVCRNTVLDAIEKAETLGELAVQRVKGGRYSRNFYVILCPGNGSRGEQLDKAEGIGLDGETANGSRGEHNGSFCDDNGSPSEPATVRQVNPNENIKEKKKKREREEGVGEEKTQTTTGLYRHGNIVLTDEQYEQLSRLYGSDQTDKMVEVFDNWSREQPGRFKSEYPNHFEALLGYARRFNIPRMDSLI